MLAVSRFVTLYLTPMLHLTAILLSLFAFLAPSLMLQDKVALFTITPSVLISHPVTSGKLDGASLFLGPLGSCSRATNAGTVTCTVPDIAPIYDLSVLPSSAPKLLLRAPSSATPVFLAIGLGLSIIFFFSFTLVSFRHVMGKAGAIFEKPLVQNISAWIGLLGFLTGLGSSLILRLWFGKAADDFNASVQSMGQNGPLLAANTGNAFAMVWVAYAFYSVPVIISLAKYNVILTNKI